ncbi:proline-rich receptor-like protein kinase PERK9 [Cryptomeria japonica]|uniref:proline-rich receptor-like protein kinase PERK9 n=1 Tax=Cryptomeria japonica TaxID=3369 RepID=UPI0027DA9269|nr:proline-rich receptor-like protein kinase PERK9 [Cryptomeria japonica]
MLVEEIKAFPTPIEFKYSELKRVTNGFVKIIGQGGFGSVFHGILPDGRSVAVKMLSDTNSVHGKTEWMNELRALTKRHHRNIVELVGYCFEDNLMLVYDYKPRNLSNIIFDEIDMIIDWSIRFKIILDMVRGLTYLHEGAHMCIIHRDIKHSNILLDENFSAKICDFGLARILQMDFAQYANKTISTYCELLEKDVTETSDHVTTELGGTL